MYYIIYELYYSVTYERASLEGATARPPVRSPNGVDHKCDERFKMLKRTVFSILTSRNFYSVIMI